MKIYDFVSVLCWTWLYFNLRWIRVYKEKLRRSLGQDRLGQDRLGQVRIGQVRLGSVRLGQDRLGQVRLGQVRIGQVRLGQDRLGQDRLGWLGQVRLGQILIISFTCIADKKRDILEFVEQSNFEQFTPTRSCSQKKRLKWIKNLCLNLGVFMSLTNFRSGRKVLVLVESKSVDS